jgi:acyl-CoA thioesterase-1
LTTLIKHLLALAFGVFTGLTAAHASVKPLILIYGDSLSAEYGLKRGAGWVALLQDRLIREGFPHRIMNASISGETTAGGLSRFDAALKKHQPSIVLLQLGANDGLRGLAISQTRRNLAEMIDRARARGAAVLLIGIRIPPNYGPDYSRQFDGLFGQLASEKQVPLVPFLLDGLADNPLMFQADTIHPNEKAQPTMLRNVWGTLSTSGLLQPAPAALPTTANGGR